MIQQGGASDIQRRLPLLAVFIAVFTLTLFIRLWYLQAIKGAYYQEQAESNRIRPVKIRPPRGIFYDRKGRPMVENVLTFDISVVPEDTGDLERTIDMLAPIVRMKPDDIRRIIDA